MSTIRQPGIGRSRRARRWLPASLAIVGALALAVALALAALGTPRPGAAAGGASVAAGAPSRPSAATPVWFRAADGSLLRGSSSGSGKRWAILVAEPGQDERAWRPLAAALAGAGLHVLALHGREQDAAKRRAGRRNVLDVLATLRFTDAQDARRQYLIGAGSGATAALVAAGKHQISALVLFSPRRTLAGIPQDATRASTAPKLFFVGSLDAHAAEDGETLFRRSLGWAVLRWLPVSLQATDLLTSSWRGAILEDTLLFLRALPESIARDRTTRGQPITRGSPGVPSTIEGPMTGTIVSTRHVAGVALAAVALFAATSPAPSPHRSRSPEHWCQ